MRKILILGAGELGGCIGHLFNGKTGFAVEWWDVDPKKITHIQKLDVLAHSADFLFLCIPSWSFRDALQSIKPHLSSSTIIVSFAKGIEHRSRMTMDQLLANCLPAHKKIVLMSGPMLAEELEQVLPASALVASKDSVARHTVVRMFNSTPLSCSASSDVRGTALCGVLKNIYALLLGASDGCQLGMNVRGTIITWSLNEMSRILPILGGRAQTAYSLAGLGDLVATGSSCFSKNYSVGKALAESGQCPVQSEGRVSLRALELLLKTHKQSFPLFCAVKKILSHPRHARAILTHILLNDK